MKDPMDIGFEVASTWFMASMSELTREERFDLLADLICDAILEDREERGIVETTN